MDLAALAAPAEVAVKVPQLRGLQIAPAALLQAVTRGVGGHVPAFDAVLEFALILREGAGEEVDLSALIGKAVPHLHRERAAQRVQPEDRVRADQVHPVDRQVRDQIPVDRVAKRLVEARTVEIDREPLRVALQRRSLEPMIEQARLERVAGSRVEGDARNLLIQRAQRIGNAAPGDVGAGQHLSFAPALCRGRPPIRAAASSRSPRRSEARSLPPAVLPLGPVGTTARPRTTLTAPGRRASDDSLSGPSPPHHRQMVPRSAPRGFPRRHSGCHPRRRTRSGGSANLDQRLQSSSSGGRP